MDPTINLARENRRGKGKGASRLERFAKCSKSQATLIPSLWGNKCTSTLTRSDAPGSPRRSSSCSPSWTYPYSTAGSCWICRLRRCLRSPPAERGEIIAKIKNQVETLVPLSHIKNASTNRTQSVKGAYRSEKSETRPFTGRKPRSSKTKQKNKKKKLC